MAPSSKVNVSKLKTFPATLLFIGCSLVIVLWITTTVEASSVNHVGIANSFHSFIQITCHSNKQHRPTYTASADEIYSFAFDYSDGKVSHQFWDCLISNTAEQPLRRASFRMWGDISHGGPELGSCTTCNWSVDERGAFLLQDSVWRFQFGWP